SSNSTPATPTATATPTTNAYEHAAQPPGGSEDASTPVNFEEPASGNGWKGSITEYAWTDSGWKQGRTRMLNSKGDEVFNKYAVWHVKGTKIRF
ncbi:hypothetical protein, partial [Kineosporia babensis]